MPYKVQSNEQLKQMVREYISNRQQAIQNYGIINTWDVSDITDMSGLFYMRPLFNEDISDWDVSNVTDMSRMFYGALSFNQPLNTWNVSNVTNMSFMFSGARVFNQPLDSWDVSNVTVMNNMFSGSYVFGRILFNQPLNSWDVSNVTNMKSMFENTLAFNQPLNNWDVSNVTDMSNMFKNASAFNQPLDSWNVSNVTDMSNMFNGATAFNQLPPPHFVNNHVDNNHVDNNHIDNNHVDNNHVDNNHVDNNHVDNYIPQPPLSPQELLYNSTNSIPLARSTININMDMESFDVIDQRDVTIRDFLSEDPNNIVFVSGSNRVGFFTKRETIEHLLKNSDGFIKYKCIIANTMRPDNIVTTIPYVGLRPFGYNLGGGLIELSKLKYVIENTEIRIVNIETPEIENLVSTVSFEVLHHLTSAMSASHCQTGQEDKVYNIKYVDVPQSAGKRTKRTTKKRTSNKRTTKQTKRTSKQTKRTTKQTKRTSKQTKRTTNKKNN
jgi:surface protein